MYEIQGLPLHPLTVHAAVILVPLAALLALLFVVPRMRGWAGLPMAVVSIAAVLSLIVAKLSGGSLKNTLERLGGGKQWESSPIGKLVLEHQSRANVLLVLMIAFAAVAVVAYFLSRRPDRFTGATQLVVCALLVVGAVAVAVQVYRVGDAGSRAVWNPGGNVDYGSMAVTVGS